MELRGLFNEFEKIIQSFKKDFESVFSKIKENTNKILSLDEKIDNVKSLITDDTVISKLQNEITNLKPLKKDIENLTLELNQSKEIINSNNKEIINYKTSINSLKEQNNQLNKEFISFKENIENSLKELKNNNNDLLNNSLKDTVVKLTSLESIVQDNISTIDNIKKSQTLENTNRRANIQIVTESINKLENRIDSLNDKILNIKLNKKDIIRILQEDGNIDLLYNLKITPRVLPKNGIDGLLILDADDNKLKYFVNNKWIIL